MSLQQSRLSASNHSSRLGKKYHCKEMGAWKTRGPFSQATCAQGEGNAPPVSTKVFLKLRPNMALLFAPFSEPTYLVGPPFPAVKFFFPVWLNGYQLRAVTMANSLMGGCGLSHERIEDGCKGTCARFGG